MQRATALGRIDFTLLKGWVNPEEWLYPSVQNALSAWTRSHRPHHEVVRIVGEPWSSASHRLRDALTRNTVPHGFYAIESDDGRHLVDQYNLDVERLPAVILHNHSVMYAPTLLEVAEAIGVHEPPSRELYDVAIVGAGPAGLAAGVYGASEGLRTMLILGHYLSAMLDQITIATGWPVASIRCFNGDIPVSRSAWNTICIEDTVGSQMSCHSCEKHDRTPQEHRDQQLA